MAGLRRFSLNVDLTKIQFLLLLIAVISAQDGPIVETTQGRIRGAIDRTEAGDMYERYFGVPYATPPLGDLRFTKSIPPSPWQDVLETISFSKGCVETDNSTETSEDCLYLNVFVPGQNRSGEGLAVMVFLHGGTYTAGTASTYPSEDLAVHGDLIVVTINYRLGAMGFLSTEDEAAPGNYGLWDVKLALEWVRDNVAAFGGSPDRLTVFGQSAGGSLTSHVYISPQTQGLLQKVICISGTSSNFNFGTAYSGSLSKTSKLVGERLGCPDVNDSLALIGCLREVEAHDVNFWGLWSCNVPGESSCQYFMPVVDGEFVPQHPSITWNETLPNDIDLITGAVIDDGVISVLFQPIDDPDTVLNRARTKETTERLLGFNFDPFPQNEAIIAAVKDQYPGIEDNDTDIRTRTASQMFTDFLFAAGAHNEASQHSIVSGATYLYDYAYPISFMRAFIPEDYDWIIAKHIEDLWSVFGEQLFKDYVTDVLNGEFSEEDKAMSSQLMSYFTNFANNGNPNEGLEVPVIWPQYTRESREYLQFSENTEVLVESEDDLENYRFWISVFPQIAFPEGTP